MSVAASVINGLQAALLLARGRPDGVQKVRTDTAGVARSFWAVAICLPGFLCLRLLAWAEEGMPLEPAHAFGIDLLFYVIGWIGFAVLSRSVVAWLGQSARWPAYIAIWNWCNVIQYLLLVAAEIPGLLGAPDWIVQTCELVALGWSLWLEWYVARLMLGIAMLPAVGLVALDVGIGLVLVLITAALV